MKKRSHAAPKRDEVLGSYPGGKSGAGIYQRLINLIPPHDLFMSPFAGHCGVARNIKPSRTMTVIDRDPNVIAWWGKWTQKHDRSPIQVIHGNGLDVLGLASTRYLILQSWRSGAFIFCDPPYVLSKRAHGKQYDFEMTDAEHRQLVDSLLELTSYGAQIMVCGYKSRLYKPLKHWRTIDHQVPTRGGLQWERIWMNYPDPVELHDYRFIGDDRRERERIRRRQRNWLSQLSAMAPRERAAMLDVLNSINKEPS